MATERDALTREVKDDIAHLLKKYKSLCADVGRGDGYHITRIDKAIAALAAPVPAAVDVGAAQAETAQAAPVVPEALHTFLNAAAGEGLVIGGVDAADLYIAIFPERYAQACATPGATHGN